MKKIFTIFAATLMSVSMMAETIVFAANSKTKEVEVTLPHTFMCDWEAENGELDLIIQELYNVTVEGWCDETTTPSASGNAAVTAGKNGDNHYITISGTFEGTATVNGIYMLDDGQDYPTELNYSLSISVKPEVAGINDTYVDGNANAAKVIRNGLLLIERNGKTYNVQGAEVK